MFQLVCDPSGVVVETTIKELVPALVNWGKELDHLLQVLLSHALGSAQRCQPLSGVEGSIESHLRALGERAVQHRCSSTLTDGVVFIFTQQQESY